MFLSLRPFRMKSFMGLAIGCVESISDIIFGIACKEKVSNCAL